MKQANTTSTGYNMGAADFHQIWLESDEGQRTMAAVDFALSQLSYLRYARATRGFDATEIDAGSWIGQFNGWAFNLPADYLTADLTDNVMQADTMRDVNMEGSVYNVVATAAEIYGVYTSDVLVIVSE